jgi:Zn-dependent peptidase ImmA (M78 family)/DNA-binding XRE family transcriptional regulator
MDQSVLDTIDPRVLGNDLQKARRKRGLTQEEAAKIIETARTTITAIEKGERRIKPGELIKLAHAYGRQVSDFVRPHPIIEPFEVQFRGPALRSEEDDEKIAPFIDQLEQHCSDYLELEQLVGAPLVRKYPREYPITGLRTEQAAEAVAIEERHRLGLGDGPVPLLRDILEQEVGLRIFYLELQPSAFSAMYIYTDQLGGCIAVNSLHPEERRRWSLAHDYGHFLVHRYKPIASFDETYQRFPESERFADAFARYSLMPTSSLARRFEELRRLKEKTTLTDIATLAHYYGVSTAALTLRLEDMKLLPTGTWDKLRERGLKVRELQQQLGLGDIPARAETFPLRYRYLAYDAFSQGLIGEGQFARFLNVDRLEARRIVEELRDQMGVVAESPSAEGDSRRAAEG